MIARIKGARYEGETGENRRGANREMKRLEEGKKVKRTYLVVKFKQSGQL